MSNEILGEGTYGCVIKPSLKCKGSKQIEYKGRVSKIMNKKDAIDEMKEMNKLKDIDNIEKFTIRTPINCKPVINNQFHTIVSQCTSDRVNQTYTKNPNNLAQLLIDDGGVDLSKFSKNIYPNLSLDDQKVFLTSFLHLFKGLKFFSDNDIIHQDIKSLNIVYNVSTGKIRYIDFGLAMSKKEFIQKSKFNKNTFAQSWSYYPPEFSCANYSSFAQSNRSKCKMLYRDYGSDNGQYKMFIKDLADSFDSYCLSLALTNLLKRLYHSPGNKISKDFLKQLNSLMQSYCESDLTMREYDLDTLIKQYGKLLKNHDIYTKAKPKPTPEILETANKLSIELKKENKQIRCPPSMPDFNPFTRKCVKKCKDEKVRNDKFRCVNKTKKATSNKPAKKYVISKELDNRKKKCAELNKDFNPITSRCNKKCKEEQQRDELFKCVHKH